LNHRDRCQCIGIFDARTWDNLFVGKKKMLEEQDPKTEDPFVWRVPWHAAKTSSIDVTKSN
jgi:hypothetical protein